MGKEASVLGRCRRVDGQPLGLGVSAQERPEELGGPVLGGSGHARIAGLALFWAICLMLSAAWRLWPASPATAFRVCVCFPWYLSFAGSCWFALEIPRWTDNRRGS